MPNDIRRFRHRRFGSKRPKCGALNFGNYTLLVIGSIETLIVVYYVITIILVSYIYGNHYVPSYDHYRRYWTSLLAVRYFVLFALFGFPVSLMARKCQPHVVYGIKNTAISIYGLTCSIATVVVLATSPRPTLEKDPVFSAMYIYGITDAVVNCAIAVAEIWFIFLACNLSKEQTHCPNLEQSMQIDQQKRDGPTSLLDLRPAESISPQASRHAATTRRNAITPDIVSALLGKV